MGDVHTHTLYSRHAYSTIEENVRAAAEAGLEILGSADHFSGMLYSEQHLRNFQYLINMGVWPRTWHGVTVLHGCEADVVSLDGSLFGQDIVVHCDITGRDLGVERTLFDRATVWPRTWHGVTVLHGCEADVVSLDGSLFGQDIVVHCDITGRDLGVERTLFDRATGDADYVIASVHDGSLRIT